MGAEDGIILSVIAACPKELGIIAQPIGDC